MKINQNQKPLWSLTKSMRITDKLWNKMEPNEIQWIILKLEEIQDSSWKYPNANETVRKLTSIDKHEWI